MRTFVGMLTAWGIAAAAAATGAGRGLAAQDTPPAVAEVRIELRRIEGCPERAPKAQEALFRDRLVRLQAQLRIDLRPLLPRSNGNRLSVSILPRNAEARQQARDGCGIELQGRGVVDSASRTLVLAPRAGERHDGELWRATVHAATLALAERAAAAAARDANEAKAPRSPAQPLSPDYQWLATGLAHRSERIATGEIDAFVVGCVVQPATLVWGGGAWRRAAGELLRRGQLPALAALLQTEADDYDLGQHVLAHALVEWLLSESAETRAPITGTAKATSQPEPKADSKLARALRAAGAGTNARQALPTITGDADLAAIERRLHAFVAKRAGLGKHRAEPVEHHVAGGHAAVFVYTREPVRARHRRIVRAALQKRHAAHTSGWRIVDRKPSLQLGPVNRAAGFWHGDELVKNIARTWPMVAVLEYAREPGATAQLDCFRRVRGRRGEGGWMLDPGVGFVAHHNAQFVTDRDEQHSYLAVPDTPTGGHVGGSEFVHRGRVQWADGTRAVAGVWTALEAPKSRTTESWSAMQTPLVDWFIADSFRKLGARRIAAVPDATRELSPWGSESVFRFPEIPAGLFAARSP
ncbi:MAG: hypothetical protein AB8H80_12735 [Planctomycetota bacterium]